MFHNIIGYYQRNIFDQEDFVKLSQSDVNFIPAEHQSEYHMYLWDSSASVFYRSYFIVTLAFLGKYCDLWRFVTQLLSDGPSDNEDDKRMGVGMATMCPCWESQAADFTGLVSDMGVYQ